MPELPVVANNLFATAPRNYLFDESELQTLFWQEPEISLGYRLTKRLLDLVVSFGLLILLSPLLILVSIAIRLSDGGPTLFRQTRVGKDGREFPFYKIRSMVVDAEEEREKLAAQNRHRDPRTFKIDSDPRITRIGRILRRFSIDELPQLWNVLRGEMSLVGPRPPVPDEVELYTDHD